MRRADQLDKSIKLSTDFITATVKKNSPTEFSDRGDDIGAD